MRAPPAVPYGDLPPATRRRLAARSLLRSLLVAVVLVAGYFALPMTRLTAVTEVFLAAGLLLLIWLLVWQIRAVASSPYPRLRMVSALATSVPLFFVIFSTTYFLMERTTPGSFNVPLSRLDALYFVVTVFATVGFGDIVAVTEPARAVVLLQMVGDLVVVGFVARAFVEALKTGLRRQGPDH